MRTKTRMWRFALVAVGVVALISVQLAFAGHKEVEIYQPNSAPYGMTYGEWSARWWQHVFALPVENHPLLDTTGEHCAEGQFGPVFFLMGTSGGPANRTQCSVPAGKSILIPIINSAFSVPDDGDSIEKITADCTAQIDAVDVESLKAEVDGVALKHLNKFRFSSPLFYYVGSQPSLYAEFCTYQYPNCYEGFRRYTYADGYWIMIEPLPVGQHTIHVEGKIPLYNFGVDVTYTLNVVPANK